MLNDQEQARTQLAREASRELRDLAAVNAASLRSIRRRLSAKVNLWSAQQTVRLAIQLVEDAPPGAYPVAYELLRYHPTAMTALRLADLQRIGKNMNSWGDVDCFAYLAGVVWRDSQIADSDVHKWTESADRWWRRAALVSTVPLNMKSLGGSGDADRTLAVCSLLVDDRDDMVVKAMSWALRALAKRNRERVEDFLSRYDRRLASRAIRETRNKMRTGRKDGKPSARVSDA